MYGEADSIKTRIGESVSVRPPAGPSVSGDVYILQLNWRAVRENWTGVWLSCAGRLANPSLVGSSVVFECL